MEALVGREHAWWDPHEFKPALQRLVLNSELGVFFLKVFYLPLEIGHLLLIAQLQLKNFVSKPIDCLGCITQLQQIEIDHAVLVVPLLTACRIISL
jgi:hypothetical protein